MSIEDYKILVIILNFIAGGSLASCLIMGLKIKMYKERERIVKKETIRHK